MKKYIISGLVGAAALMLSTAVFAAVCSMGNIVATGSGDTDSSSKVGITYTMRWVDAVCENDSSLSGRFYFHPSTDPDGKLEIALRSMAENKPVSYTIYDAIPDTYIVSLQITTAP